MKTWTKVLIAVIFCGVVFGLAVFFNKNDDQAAYNPQKIIPRWGKVLIIKDDRTSSAQISKEIGAYLEGMKVPYDLKAAGKVSFKHENLWDNNKTLKYSIVIFANTTPEVLKPITSEGWDELDSACAKGLRLVFTGVDLKVRDSKWFPYIHAQKIIAWDTVGSLEFKENLQRVENIFSLPVYKPAKDSEVLIAAIDPQGSIAWNVGNTYVSADNGLEIIRNYVIDKAIRDANIPVVPNMFALINDDITGLEKDGRAAFTTVASDRLLQILKRHDAYVTNGLNIERINPSLIPYLITTKNRYINCLSNPIYSKNVELSETAYTNFMDKMIYYKLVSNYSNKGVYVAPTAMGNPYSLQVLNKYGIKYVANETVTLPVPLKALNINGMNFVAPTGSVQLSKDPVQPAYSYLWALARTPFYGMTTSDKSKVEVLNKVQKDYPKIDLSWGKAMELWLEQTDAAVRNKAAIYTSEANYVYDAPALEILQNVLQYLELRANERTTFYDIGEYQRNKDNYTISSLIQGDWVKVYIKCRKPVTSLTLYQNDFDQVTLDKETVRWQKHDKQKKVIRVPNLEPGNHMLLIGKNKKAEITTAAMAVPADGISKLRFNVKTLYDNPEVNVTKGTVSKLEETQKGNYKGMLHAGATTGWGTIYVRDQDGSMLGSKQVYIAPPDLKLDATVQSKTDTDKLTITGNAWENAEIRINHLKIVNNLGSFQAELPVKLGTNYITIVASDKEGNTQTLIKNYFRQN